MIARIDPSEGDDTPPAVTPLRGSFVATDRPTLTWNALPGADSYQVRLATAGRSAPLWTATTTAPRLPYPSDQDPLRRGRKYAWRVVARTAGGETRPVTASQFTVASPAAERKLAELNELSGSDDPVDVLAAALVYETAYGAYDEALAAYERLAHLVPDEPSYQTVLARYYERAGRPKEAGAARARAGEARDVRPTAP